MPVIHGDCLEILAGLPPASMDAVVTDPPYGMKYRSNRRVVAEKHRPILNDESVDVFTAAAPLIDRALKPNTHVYVFCSWHHVDKFKAVVEQFWSLKNLLVWNKNNHGSGDLKGAYAPKHELILFAHKGRREISRRLPDVLDFARIPSHQLQHPTEKPLALLKTLLEVSTRPGEIVLDPFAGSGSLGEAALALARDALLIEQDDEHHRCAASRFAKAESRALAEFFA